MSMPLHSEDPWIARMSHVVNTKSEKAKRAATLLGLPAVLPQPCSVSRPSFSRPQQLLIHPFH